MKNKVIVIGICLIIITSNIQPIFAEIFFPTTNFRLQGPPTYCIVIPDDNISEQQKTQWANLVKNTILTWEEKLKTAETVNDNLWDINVEIISEEEAENCGINIYFKDKPSLVGAIVGLFTWPPGSITIYYLQLEVCDLSTCYDDSMFISDDAISAIALHEVGHSMGLDHYISDESDTNSKWQTSNNTPPSIMIPSIHNNPTLQEITNVDINKVREIYGSDGFYAFSSIQIPDPTPVPDSPTIAPIIPGRPFDTVNVSQKIIEVEDHSPQTIKISGKVSIDKLLRGHSVIITVYKPDQTIQILKTSVTGNGNFETFLIFDKNSIRGNYQVSVSYTEHVDKDMDVDFQVVNKNTINPIAEESSQIESGISKEIPEWVKNNAGWWAEGAIDDEAFVTGIEFLISKEIINVTETTNSQSVQTIPEWVKNNAEWWAEGAIDDEAFVNSLKYLVEYEIIKIN